MDSFYIWHKWSLLLDNVSHVRFFAEPGNLNFWQIYEIFSALTLKKNTSVLDGFFPYLAQMITSMRGCVAYKDLWPWPITSRSFGLGLENRVFSAASTVPDGFFPYLVQMITSMRRCVTCDDLWPWPIFSRSFDIDLENRVRSVLSTVLVGLFLYLAQIITIIRECFACYFFFQNLKIWIFGKFFGLDLEKKIYSSWWILSIFSTANH